MMVCTCRPATQEAEVGGLPELRRWRLQWAETEPLHSSLGDGVWPYLKEKKLLILITTILGVLLNFVLFAPHCSPGPTWGPRMLYFQVHASYEAPAMFS